MFCWTRDIGIAYAAIPCGTNCENVTNTPTTSISLNGTDQIVDYTLGLSVNSIPNLGWRVTITSTTFQTGTTPSHTLPTTSSSIINTTAVCRSGELCTTMPNNTVSYPVAVPTDNPAPTAVRFYNATALSGIGTFDLSATVRIAIPANVYAGTYTSTYTLAYISGP